MSTASVSETSSKPSNLHLETFLQGAWEGIKDFTVHVTHDFVDQLKTGELELRSRPAGTPTSPPAPPVPAKDQTPGMAALDAYMAGKDMNSIMQDVAAGNLPKDVLNDPGALQAFTARVQRFQEAMALMSNMLKALHDMKLSIINNIRG